MKNYIALFEQGNKGGYSVVFPDVPGVVTAGNNFDEALRMAHEALAFHIDSLRADGEVIPEPRTIEKIGTEWEDWNEWKADGDFLVVPIALLPSSEKSVRVNVMLPEGILQRIDAVSKNRSAFLANAAARLLNDESLPS